MKRASSKQTLLSSSNTRVTLVPKRAKNKKPTSALALKPQAEQLFYDYPYKNFQHNFQKIAPRRVAVKYREEFENSDLKVRLFQGGALESSSSPLLGLASLRVFSSLSEVTQKKAFLLRDFIAKAQTIDNYRALAAALFEQVGEKFDFIVTKQPIDNAPAVNALLERGFYYLCGEAVYSIHLHSPPPAQPAFSCIRRAQSRADFRMIENIAAKNHQHKRYLLDPNLTPQAAQQLYHRTLEASFKDPKHHLFVYEAAGCIQGFITLMLNSPLSNFLSKRKAKNTSNFPLRYGSLDYIAVAKSAQKKGVGIVLNQYGLSFLYQQGARVISVKTMSNNYPACRLLAKSKFLLTSQNIILHYCRK